MTTDTEKAHLGIAALYAQFASAPYTSKQHWNTHRAFTPDPMLCHAGATFVPDPLYMQVSYEFKVDARFVG